MIKFSYKNNYKFTEVAYKWLETKRDIKLQSYQKYESLIKGKINKYIGNILISKISRQDINYFLNKLKEDNLSNSLQKTLFYIVKASITFGYDNKYCNYIDLKDIRFKASNKQVEVFTKDEQTIIENNIKNNMNMRKLGLLLCLYTGLRLGEVCGLKWGNINFNCGSLEIKRTIQRIKNPNGNNPKTMLIASTPKSKTSNRIVPIPKFIINYLEKFKSDDNFFLLSNSTKLYDPRDYEAFFKRFLKKCGINENHFHTLRHTFSTRAIESKMDIKTLSEILGHSSVEITLQIYVHPSYEFKKASIENLVNFMAIS